MKELWKDIKGFEGLYQVSNLGRIKRLSHTRYARNNSVATLPEQIIKLHDNGKGYLQARLSKNNKKTAIYIHRLVYETFINEIKEGYEINHKDENKTNNCVTNLEQITHVDNCRYGTRNIRSGQAQSKKVRCLETNVIFNSVSAAGKYLGVSQGSISCSCLRGTKVKNTHWEYIKEKEK